MTTRIRLATAADAQACADIYAPVVELTSTSFETVPPTASEMAARIAHVQTLAPWLVYEQDDQILGYAYAGKHRERAAYQWSVDVSVYVREKARGQGVGRALYSALLAILRLQGFYAAHAGITLPNAGSVALHEAFGFRPIGVYPGVGHKLGCWHDVGWWQLELRARTETPALPLSMDAVMREPGWSAALLAGHLPPPTT